MIAKEVEPSRGSIK